MHRIISGVRWMGLLALVLALALASSASAAAFEADPVRYNMISLAEPGGRALFYFEVRNVSAAAWAPGSVTLNNTKNPMGGPAQASLSRSVLPNETAYWDFEGAAPKLPGVHESAWEVRRGGTVISPRMTCYIIAVPKEAQELRAKIQKLIDEFNHEHGHEIEQVVRLVRELIEREGGGLIERLIETRCGLLSGMMVMLGVLLVSRRVPGEMP